MDKITKIKAINQILNNKKQKMIFFSLSLYRNKYIGIIYRSIGERIRIGGGENTDFPTRNEGWIPMRVTEPAMRNGGESEKKLKEEAYANRRA